VRGRRLATLAWLPYTTCGIASLSASRGGWRADSAGVPNIQPVEPDAGLLLSSINLIMQAVEVNDKVLGLLTAPVMSKVALMGAAAGDAGDGVGLLVRMCSNTGLLRQAVQTLLAEIRWSTSTHYDAKEQVSKDACRCMRPPATM
jgi:hypothetical protein